MAIRAPDGANNASNLVSSLWYFVLAERRTCRNHEIIQISSLLLISVILVDTDIVAFAADE